MIAGTTGATRGLPPMFHVLRHGLPSRSQLRF